jgi:hypothetical protein
MARDGIYGLARNLGTCLQTSCSGSAAPVDDLPSRQPALTVAGGRAVHDPDGLFG